MSKISLQLILDHLNQGRKRLPLKIIISLNCLPTQEEVTLPLKGKKELGK